MLPPPRPSSSSRAKSSLLPRPPSATNGGGGCGVGRFSTTCLFLSLLCFSLVLLLSLPSLYRRRLKPIVFVWPENQTRHANTLIFHNVSTTLMSPSTVCRRRDDGDSGDRSLARHKAHNDSAPPDVVLLVVVCSALGNAAARTAVRESWARPELTPDRVKVVFLVGQRADADADAEADADAKADAKADTVEPSHLQEDVIGESQRHGDIVQERFVDTYANLTVKSLMLLKWFDRNCDGVPYVLKTDDDVYVNLNALYALALANREPNLLVGSLICGAVPIRDPYNKWYAPKYMYSRPVYPNYLSGTAYLLSRSAAQVLLEAAGDVAVFHLEDIYVTGLLSSVVGLRPKDHVGFSFAKRSTSQPCLYAQTISSHQLTGGEMRRMANALAAMHRREATGAKPTCKPLRKAKLRNYGPGKCVWPKQKHR